MQYVKTIHILTKVYNEFDVITPQVEAIVAESGVKNGMVTVLTKHTTTGVTVNEALECLESDIAVSLSLFAPEDPTATPGCSGTTAPPPAIPPGI